VPPFVTVKVATAVPETVATVNVTAVVNVPPTTVTVSPTT
jgi:hypothetical protein